MRTWTWRLVAAIVGCMLLGVFAGVALANAGSSKVRPNLPLAQGIQGAKFAVVNADGSLARGKGVKSSSNTGSGTYSVLFNKDISHCSWIAGTGFGGSGSVQPASFATAAAKVGATNGVTVSTFSSLGLAANEPFLLQVMC